MKNIILTSLLSVTLLSSCSWIFGKDKNELQPNLAGAARTPVNQQSYDPAQPNAPMMVGMGQPMPNQPEVFMNQNVGLGTAPTAMPDMMGNPQMPPMDMGMAQPAPVQIADQSIIQPQMPVMAPAVIPAQVTGNNEPTVIAQISKNKRLPASLLPSYNNPLNYDKVAVAPVAPAPQPMMMQPMQQPMMPMMQPAGGMPMMGMPMTQPVNAPTMPVQQMQMQPVPTQMN